MPRQGQQHSQRRQARPQLEQLEDRNLLDAAFAADHILVGYLAGDKIDVKQVAVEDGSSIEQALADYQSAEGVAFAEVDYEVQTAVIPNDASFGSLFGLHNTGQSGGTANADIDAPEAWNLTTGSTRVTVAIIDTGIDYTHPDLYLNIWINQGEIPTSIRNQLQDLDGDGLITFWDLNDSRNQGTGKILDANGNDRIDGGDLLASTTVGGWANTVDEDLNGKVDDFVGWDFANNDNNPMDDNNHGTHVAGTIGGIGNNGVGVAGVNWKVQLMALKFLAASGSGSTSNAAYALNYAVGEGARVSNNSWGGGGYNTTLYNAINSARSANHLFVAAAGNSNVNNDVTAHYPSSYNLDNVLAVASTDRNNLRSSFSNYGATSVDVAAPGSSIYSTIPGGGYATFSGTSMATPHVAGLAALLLARNSSLSYSQLASLIKGNVELLPALTGLVATGGRINAFRALSAATPPADSTGPRVVSATVLNGNPGVRGVRLTFSEAINASTFGTADIGNFTGFQGVSAAQSVTPVTGSSTQFDVVFNQQTLAGNYGFDVGPDVRDLANNPMDQDADGVPGETTQDRHRVTFVINPSLFFSSSPNVAIPDKGTRTANLTVSPSFTITDVNVQLNITHTWDSDLYITLRSPTGQTVILANRRGGSGDNFTSTIFNDEATTLIRNGAAPFSGSYRPEGTLSTFDGRNATGTWVLTIQDKASGDVGTLVSWSLTFEGSAGTTGARSVAEVPTDGSLAAVGDFDAFLTTLVPALERDGVLPLVQAFSAASEEGLGWWFGADELVETLAESGLTGLEHATATIAAETPSLEEILALLVCDAGEW